ncbi:citrate lyase acyl carrier protein [Salinivirga cyanobacteriivorans]
MKPKHKAQAGTFESSDIMVLIEPINDGEENSIELSSNVGKHFSQQIKNAINQVLEAYDISGVHLIAKDKGALTPTIKARVETAVKRSLDMQKGTLQ